MSEKWRPLSSRRAPEKSDALFDGVPPHLAWSLQDWVRSFFPKAWEFQGDYDATRALLMDIEVALQISIGREGGHEPDVARAFVNALPENERVFLDLIDFLLTRRPGTDKIQRLERVLDEGGSLWTTALAPDRSRWELQERVDETTQAVVAAATSAPDNPSAHLSMAWSGAFGRKPSAASAYDEAVKALEAAFQPIVSPKHATATLGTMIRDIDSKPEKFATSLEGKGSGSDGVLAVRASLNVIWQTAVRHGSGLPEAPTSVSITQARDAVVMAASLVQLVRQGGFRLA